MTRVCRTLFTIADRANTRGCNAFRLQRALRGFCAALAEREVIFVGAALVAMSFERDGPIGPLAEQVGILANSFAAILTDFGAMVGQMSRGLKVDMRRLKLLAILMFSFTVGGVLGVLFYGRWEYLAMLVPATMVGAAAAVYLMIRRSGLTTS